MLNTSGVKVEHFGNVDQILVNSAPRFAVGVVVSSDGVDADAYGRKIVHAGTPLSGDLDDRTTPFTIATTAADVVGFLQHDVDVTAGEENGSIVLIGVINYNSVSDSVKTLLTEDVRKALPSVKIIAL